MAQLHAGQPEAPSLQQLPFLRWAGGKQRLLGDLLRQFPERYGTYFEPFLGGASVFFRLNPGTAVLGDVNQKLIETYQVVQTDVESVIRNVKRLQNTKDEYYRIRDQFKPKTQAGRAARFLYLNRMCWNGLYRENAAGQFNVPYGYRCMKVPWDYERLRGAARRLGAARLVAGDFAQACSSAIRGDFVYFDPPYVTSHNNNGFIEYNSQLFLWDDQVRLAKCASKLVERGVQVVVSNAAHDALRPLYPDFSVTTITRHSTIAGTNDARKKTDEFLFCGGF